MDLLLCGKWDALYTDGKKKQYNRILSGYVVQKHELRELTMTRT